MPTDLLLLIVAKDYNSLPNIAKLKFPQNFRLQVCRDIVGNTICADFIDYVHRDWHHLGKGKHFDQRIFQYMEIRKDKQKDEDAFVISLGRKDRPRTDAITAVVNLLEHRYQLAESVYFHRSKCKAGAMLERVWMEIADATKEDDARRNLLDQLEDEMLDHSDWSALMMLSSKVQNIEAASLPLGELMQRQLYEDACTIHIGDFTSPDQDGHIDLQFSSGADSPKNRLEVTRALEKDFVLPSGSIVMYCPTKGMNAKIPEVKIHIGNKIDTYTNWNNSNHNVLDHGLIHAELQRFRNLWRAQIFVHRKHWKNWPNAVQFLFKDHVKTNVFSIARVDENPESTALRFAKSLAYTEGSPYFGQEVNIRKAARRTPGYLYPSGMPLLSSLFERMEDNS